MTAAALILLLLFGLGIFTRSMNKWTRLLMILIIIGALIVFYLT